MRWQWNHLKAYCRASDSSFLAGLIGVLQTGFEFVFVQQMQPINHMKSFALCTIQITTVASHHSLLLLLIQFLPFSLLTLHDSIALLQHSTTLLHPFNGLFSRTTWVSRHQNGKPFWILMKQEVMGWQWHQLDQFKNWKNVWKQPNL